MSTVNAVSRGDLDRNMESTIEGMKMPRSWDQEWNEPASIDVGFYSNCMYYINASLYHFLCVWVWCIPITHIYICHVWLDACNVFTVDVNDVCRVNHISFEQRMWLAIGHSPHSCVCPRIQSHPPQTKTKESHTNCCIRLNPCIHAPYFQMLRQQDCRWAAGDSKCFKMCSTLIPGGEGARLPKLCTIETHLFDTTMEESQVRNLCVFVLMDIQAAFDTNMLPPFNPGRTTWMLTKTTDCCQPSLSNHQNTSSCIKNTHSRNKTHMMQ